MTCWENSTLESQKRTIVVSLKYQKIITLTRQCCDIMICKLWHWVFPIMMTAWWRHECNVTSTLDGEPRDKIWLQTRPSPKVDCSRLNRTMIILWTGEMFYCLELKPDVSWNGRRCNICNWHWRPQNKILATPPLNAWAKYSKDPLWAGYVQRTSIIGSMRE